MKIDATARLRVATAPPAVLNWIGCLNADAIVISAAHVNDDWLTSAAVYQFRGRVWEEQGERLTPERPDGRPTESGMDPRGVVRVGTAVGLGDRLIGRTRATRPTPEEQLLLAIHGTPPEGSDAAVSYPYRDSGVVTAARVLCRRGTTCPSCGDVPHRNGKCPFCGAETRGLAVEELPYGADVEAVVEVLVRRELRAGDVVRDAGGQAYTVARIVPEGNMPEVDGRTVSVLCHPNSALAAGLATDGTLRHTSLRRVRDKACRWGWVKLRKATDRTEETLVARGNGRYDEFTRRPSTALDGPPAQVVSGDVVAAVLRAGFAVNAAELLTIKSDDGVGRPRAKPGAVLSPWPTDPEPECVSRFRRIVRAARVMADGPDDPATAAGLSLRLAESTDVYGWSHGGVRAPELRDSRTHAPVKDGLFCERIFGPERDWECACGKYRGTKYAGMICDRCGVKVTHSRVREQRLGHVDLPTLVVHPWLYRTTRILPDALGLPPDEFEAVVHLNRYVVRVPGKTGHRTGEVIGTDAVKAAARDEAFEADTGGEAIRWLIDHRNLTHLHAAVFDAVPVLPAGLREVVFYPETRQRRTPAINAKYQSVVLRAASASRRIDMNAPELIIRNDRLLIQKAVDELFDSSAPGAEEPACLRGLLERAAADLIRKPVEYSARGVVVPDGTVERGRIGLPAAAVAALFPEGGAAPEATPVLVVTDAARLTVLRPVPTAGEPLRINPDDGRQLGLTYAGERVLVLVPLSAMGAAELDAMPTPVSAESALHRLTAASVADLAVRGASVTLHPLDRLALGDDPRTIERNAVSVSAIPPKPVLPAPPPPPPVAVPTRTQTPPKPPHTTEPAARPAEARAVAISPQLAAYDVGMMEVSAAVKRGLRACQIRTVGELVRLTADELLATRQITPAGIDNIRVQLAAIGHRLWGE